MDLRLTIGLVDLFLISIRSLFCYIDGVVVSSDALSFFILMPSLIESVLHLDTFITDT
jgi:hypothetical protein